MRKLMDVRELHQQMRPRLKLSSFKVWLWRAQHAKQDPFPVGIQLSPRIKGFDPAKVDAWLTRRARTTRRTA